MMKSFLPIALGCLLALPACAPSGIRIVDARDPAGFVAMSRAMRPAMLERNLVDGRGDWYSPSIILETEQAGAVLLNGLSPRFCADELDILDEKSFRELLMPSDKATVSENSTVVRTQGRTVSLRLVAVTDWNGDGRKDWLVTCRVNHDSTPSRVREYFLLLIDGEKGAESPYVLMERELAFGKYIVLRDSSMTAFLGAETVEIEQGQAVVTHAPGTEDPSFDQSKVRSSSLSD